MDFLTAATSSFRLRSADTVFRRKSVREQSPSDTPITPDAKENPSEDATRPKLITYDQLPEWCEGNAFIPTGYRAAPADSTAACLHSLMYLHNETCNIYSHLIPAIFAASFAGLIAYRHGLFSDLRERNAQAIDVGMLALHLATMAMCFALSACFHTMLCHSKTVSRRWLRGDYAGIVGLMWGSFLPGIYFGFFDEEETIWRWVYWTMVSSCAEESTRLRHRNQAEITAIDFRSLRRNDHSPCDTIFRKSRMAPISSELVPLHRSVGIRSNRAYGDRAWIRAAGVRRRNVLYRRTRDDGDRRDIL